MLSNHQTLKSKIKQAMQSVSPGFVLYSQKRPANQNCVALTFDDGPHPDYTPKILSILRLNNVKATFFLQGQAVQRKPRLVQQIQQQGHQIGNHSYSHRRMSHLNFISVYKEINRTNRLIEKITGKRPLLFRPPFGELTLPIIVCSLFLKMKLIFWSFDSKDYIIQSADIIRKRFKNLQSGNIILFHDDYAHTPEALNAVIKDLVARNFRLVTIDEMK